MKTGTEVFPDLSHISTDIAVQVSITHIEAVPDHDIGIITTITEVAHDVQAPHTRVTPIASAVTHPIDHTTDLQCTEVHHTTQEIRVTCIHAHHTNS